MSSKFQKLEENYLSLLSEYNTLKCKLECKRESLLILSRDLEQCRSEKQQYKLMADQLRERYSALKKRVEGWGPSLMSVYDVDGLKCQREKSLAQLLCDLKEQNKVLKYENSRLKQNLEDAAGDIKILREEIAKYNERTSDQSYSSNFVPFSEKEMLVKQLETQKVKFIQITRDLQAVLDEKEELVGARDQYKLKYERLNQQMNYILRGDQQKPIDIDGLLLENKYLQERVKQSLEEKTAVEAALAKCRALLEKKRSKGGMRNTIATGLAISARQVEQLLQNNSFLDASSKSSNSLEFRNLIVTLLENLSDKTIELSHQKKTNKILGNRVTELEERIKSMEVSTLWRLPDPNQIAVLLRSTENCDLLEKNSQQTLASDDNPEKTRETSPKHANEPSEPFFDPNSDLRPISGFSDLDILPTKDCSMSPSSFDRQSTTSSCSHYSDSKLSFDSPSPNHESRPSHSDSEAACSRKSSISERVTAADIKNRHDWSSLNMEDLPPHLQKFIESAFEDNQTNGIENEETLVRSPQRKPAEAVIAQIFNPDPDC